MLGFNYSHLLFLPSVIARKCIILCSFKKHYDQNIIYLNKYKMQKGCFLQNVKIFLLIRLLIMLRDYSFHSFELKLEHTYTRQLVYVDIIVLEAEVLILIVKVRLICWITVNTSATIRRTVPKRHGLIKTI